MANNGRSLYDVRHLLGHSDPSVTQRYAHLSAGALQEASEAAAQSLQDPQASKCPDVTTLADYRGRKAKS